MAKKRKQNNKRDKAEQQKRGGSITKERRQNDKREEAE